MITQHADTDDNLESMSSPAIDIKAERIHFLYRSAHTAIMVNILIAALTVWILWGRVDQQHLFYWITLLVIITLLRGIGVFLFNRNDGTHNLRLWYLLFLVKSTLSGLTWGLSIWFFAPFDDLITPILIVFVLGGLTAGAAAILGSVLTVYYSYIIAIMLPVTVWFYLQPDATYSVMGVMLTVYIFAMMMAGYLYRKVLIHSITVSHDLIQAKLQAEKANRAKTDFLSSMSHEFRTPLNSILGFAQLLQLEAKSTLAPDQIENVNFILKSGHHLLNLVNDVLDLAKIETNTAVLVLENINLKDIVSEAIDLIKTFASNRNITIDYQVHCDFDVIANKTKLRQVLLNLLNNAVKYNRESGSITILCQQVDDDFVRIEVRDTGVGIAEDHHQKVFTAFDRIGHENSTIEGTGIGLVVTKHIIEAMNGRMGFSSQEGQGSCFWFELPTVTS